MDRAIVEGAVVGGAFGALLLLEWLAPLRERRRDRWPRWGANLAIAIPGLAVAALALAPVVDAVMAWSAEHRFGLLGWLEAPPLLEAALAFLLLDLTFYGWHRANHRWPLLWRFHAVHHADPDLDLTTAARFHFGEMALSIGFRAVQLVLIGPTLSALLAYELAFRVATLFHHSNLRLPALLDRGLRALIVTPRAHGVHHSQVRAETDSNFGVVLSVWDRVFGSWRGDAEGAAVTIGVPGLDGDGDAAGAMLASPFGAQPTYWARREASQASTL